MAGPKSARDVSDALNKVSFINTGSFVDDELLHAVVEEFFDEDEPDVESSDGGDFF